MDGPCKRYVGVACVDGSCPRALRDEHADRGMPIISNCADCPYCKGCEDCAFAGTDVCLKPIGGVTHV